MLKLRQSSMNNVVNQVSMRKMFDSHWKSRIAVAVETFVSKKTKSNPCVSEWDDAGGRYLILRRLFMIMMVQIDDSCRGKDPAMNDAHAAGNIPRPGRRFNKLAAECSEPG